MVETSKQVRVDNWGIFFLSRLQVFFNKTDYCDLTLQFEGNVQLKVHRLVMNACTEYFQMLEQTCEVNEDVLLMPPDLQADVILPIVNFMYTGMLEFQTSIFEKLYKTAELMNMTVLLKLLDAQKQPHVAPKAVVTKVPPTYNLQGKKIVARAEKGGLPATLPGRKLPVWKRKSAPSPAPAPPMSSFASEPVRRVSSNESLGAYDNSPKPTRFEWPEEDLKNFPLLDQSFDNISYTSRPLLTQEEELRASTSFDSVKFLPSTNKKSQDYNTGNVDMDDLKNYVKEQKIRSDMVEFEEDDVDNDLDPDYHPGSAYKRKTTRSSAGPAKRVRFSLNEKENNDAKINISGGKGGDMDHSKIISEVLKKYPHLVKKNKNIRLKILAKNKQEPQRAPEPAKVAKAKVPIKTTVATGAVKETKGDEGPWTCDRCLAEGEDVEFVLYYLYRKHMTDVHNEKFDSRMCKYCGHKSNKHNMLMYHQYTKHGIKPPAAYNFPKCNQCLYVALTETLMIKHKLNHTKFDLQCSECKVGFNSDSSLRQHAQITGHTGKAGRTNYDCQYCTKHYQTGSSLFSHIRLMHRDEARRDGIVSIDEEDLDEEAVDEEPVEHHADKIKVLSDVSVPSQGTTFAEARPEEALNSGLATSLGLVDIVVLDENQQYILHSNNQPDGQEYILPELSDAAHAFVQNPVVGQTMLGNPDIASTDELVMVLTDHDYNDGNSEILANDNSNIVVLYSHPVEGGQGGQFITSQGNLMLNSETGMLELRNGTVQNTTDIQGGAVESIEMIQREIDSHVGVKTLRDRPVLRADDENVARTAGEVNEVIVVEEEIVGEEGPSRLGVAEEHDANHPKSDQQLEGATQDVENADVAVESGNTEAETTAPELPPMGTTAVVEPTESEEESTREIDAEETDCGRTESMTIEEIPPDDDDIHMECDNGKPCDENVEEQVVPEPMDIDDESGVIGEETGIVSDESGVIGDESGVAGDQSGVIDDESGVAGDESGVAGDQSGVADDQSGVVVDESGVVVEESGATGEGLGVIGDESGIINHGSGVVGDGSTLVDDGLDVIVDAPCMVDDGSATIIDESIVFGENDEVKVSGDTMEVVQDEIVSQDEEIGSTKGHNQNEAGKLESVDEFDSSGVTDAEAKDDDEARGDTTVLTTSQESGDLNGGLTRDGLNETDGHEPANDIESGTILDECGDGAANENESGLSESDAATGPDGTSRDQPMYETNPDDSIDETNRGESITGTNRDESIDGIDRGEIGRDVSIIDETNRDDSIHETNREEAIDETNRDESTDETNRDESIDRVNRGEIDRDVSVIDEANQDESVDESNSTMEEDTSIAAAGDKTVTETEKDETATEISEDSEDRIKAAKISILDDWEDTDSQQSDHGKSTNTVNKLINDWDDD